MLNLSVAKADYSELSSFGRFDLIATCMAFHWFDAEGAIASYKAASNHGAIWLIYNFAFGGHTSSETFNAWLQETYLRAYPSPPRGAASDVTPSDDPDVQLLASDRGWLPVDFSKDSLVGYLSTQSNIEHRLQQGDSLEQIVNTITEELRDMDLTGSFKYLYSYEILQYKRA